MKINIKKTIIPNQTFEPYRKFPFYNEIENKLSYGVGAWMAENNFDVIENDYNGDFGLFMDDNEEMFWIELKRRANLFYNEEFIGWVSIKGVLIEIPSPCEHRIIDEIISHKIDIYKLIDYKSNDPVEIIVYFESIEDNEEEKNWIYNQNPDDYELI